MLGGWERLEGSCPVFAKLVLANRVPLGPCCRLRPVDVEFMKALHEKVNIVPLIAKADCLIPSEIRKLKERVRCPFSTGVYLVWGQGCVAEGEEQDTSEADREIDIYICIK